MSYGLIFIFIHIDLGWNEKILLQKLKNLRNKPTQREIILIDKSINDYRVILRKFLKIPTLTIKYLKLYWNKTPHNIITYKFYFHLFNRHHSHINRNYNQQFIGNLQIIRQLFIISWSYNTYTKNIEVSQKIFLNKNIYGSHLYIFDHENREKYQILQNIYIQRKIFQTCNKNQWSSCILILIKMHYFIELYIQTKPIQIITWDICNYRQTYNSNSHILNWSIKNNYYKIIPTKRINFQLKKLNNIQKFLYWPRTIQSKKIQFKNVRYNL